MNKKALLLGLPICALLIPCIVNANAKSYNRDHSLKNSMIDGEGGDELFDEAEYMVVKHSSISSSSKSTSSIYTNQVEEWVEPQIGVQYTTDGDKAAIRFIAAIRVVDSNSNGLSDELNSLSLVWAREVYTPNGAQLKPKEYRDSTKLYTSFNDGGHLYTISEYNQMYGTNYTHFVTYVMKNIPISTHGSDYILASLQANVEAPSRVYASTLTPGTAFKFDATDTGYFGVEYDEENKAFTTIPCPMYSVESNRYATKFEVPVPEKPYFRFLLCMKTATMFKVYGYNEMASDSAIAATRYNDTNIACVATEGHYSWFANYFTLFITKSDEKIQIATQDMVNKYTLNTKNDMTFGYGSSQHPILYLKLTITDDNGNVDTYNYLPGSTKYEVNACVPDNSTNWKVTYVAQGILPNSLEEICVFDREAFDYYEAYCYVVTDTQSTDGIINQYYEWDTNHTMG